MGPWCVGTLSHPWSMLKPYNDLGDKLRGARRAKQRANILKPLALALAVTGIGSAVSSIMASGLSVANVAGLVSSIDAIPGVDLGAAGDLAKVAKGGFKVDDFTDITLPEVEFESFDLDIPSFDIAPADIGAVVDEFTLIELGDLGIDTESLGIDLSGAIYDDTGELVNPSIEVYAQSIYVGDDGGIYDFANQQLLTPAQAEAAFNEGGIDELTAQTWAAASGLGNTFVAEQPNAARPASTPAARSTGVLPQFSGDSWPAFLLNAASTIGNFVLAREQIQRTGRYTPPGSTSPYGTANPIRVGVPQAQPDGSIVVKNADGTVTRTNLDGTQTTIRPGAQTSGLGGISTNTLLLGGGILAAVLLLRR
ncbi:MAG: hypothetical protein EBV34_19010 [Betaproteobacteria bacterium]|nr:hypothetical protein [Betaproteobacteria bacterium]